jgi:two-component system, NtrC family, sensor kinase
VTAILIVDDQLELLAITGAILAENGYAVSWAPTAAAALKLLNTHRIDVLLTDIIMPGEIDGFELARRAKLTDPDLKVIYCTGFSNLEPEQIGPTHGPLLKKPYTPSRLLALLKNVTGDGYQVAPDLHTT